MRTTEEILARITELEETDIFGFERNDLIEFLPFEAARKWLKPDVTTEKWEEKGKLIAPLRTDEHALEVMRDYFDFAVEKACGHRGNSASRTISHYRAWLWLLGDDELVAFTDQDDSFKNYGCPILKRVAEKYGYTVPASDRESFERMAEGKPCREGCDEGCGS